LHPANLARAFHYSDDCHKTGGVVANLIIKISADSSRMKKYTTARLGSSRIVLTKPFADGYGYLELTIGR
jgi:hypothetical protein